MIFDKKNELDRLRTVFWSRFLFKALGLPLNGISNGEDKEQLTKTDRLDFLKKQLSNEKKEALEDLFGVGTITWRRYLDGTQGIKSRHSLVSAAKLFSGSEKVFDDGPFYLFKMLETKDAPEAWEILEKAFIQYLKVTEENYYFPENSECREDQDEILDISINNFFSSDWSNAVHRLSLILPHLNIDSKMEEIEERASFYLHLVCASFIAKFTTNIGRFDWLGKLLFSELHGGLVYKLHDSFGIPISIWYESHLFRKTAEKMGQLNLLPEDTMSISENLKKYQPVNTDIGGPLKKGVLW